MLRKFALLLSGIFAFDLAAATALAQVAQQPAPPQFKRFDTLLHEVRTAPQTRFCSFFGRPTTIKPAATISIVLVSFR
jgi:hypothetical protein